jgi:hypothetical protein
MNEPIGSLCLLPDETHNHWLVSICQGHGNKKVLRRFESRDKALEFAIEQRAKWLACGSKSATIHIPDDCPCSANSPTW